MRFVAFDHLLVRARSASHHRRAGKYENAYYRAERCRRASEHVGSIRIPDPGTPARNDFPDHPSARHGAPSPEVLPVLVCSLPETPTVVKRVRSRTAGYAASCTVIPRDIG